MKQVRKCHRKQVRKRHSPENVNILKVNMINPSFFKYIVYLSLTDRKNIIITFKQSNSQNRETIIYWSAYHLTEETIESF